MADKLGSQLDSSNLIPDESSIELNYPRIPVPSSLANLLNHSSSTAMAGPSYSSNPDNALSGSWTNLSDADYSIDDDSRSETTDAASLLDQTGSDDVDSLDDHTSDGGSEDAQSERSISQDLPLPRYTNESTKTLGNESVDTLKGSRLGSSIELQPTETNNEAGFTEVTGVVDILGGNVADEVAGHLPDGLVVRVCMTISKNNLSFDRPFRLLYIGDSSARAEILAKVANVLTATPEHEHARHGLDTSRCHLTSSTSRSDLTSNRLDLVPIKNPIVVDDCFTAASMTNHTAHDEIFVSLKNGALYSSRWNGTRFEVFSASEWSPPDLAIFFVADDDDHELKQRHQLANNFASRHHIPWLVISKNISWAESSHDLQVDPSSPHLRIEAEDNQGCLIKRIPIDLESFSCLESGQLNKNLAYLCNEARNGGAGGASRLLPAPKDGRDSSGSDEAIDPVLSKRNTWVSWASYCKDGPLSRSIILAAAGLISLFIGLAVCRISLLLLIQLLSPLGGASGLSAATTWSLQSPSVPTISERTAAIIPTANLESASSGTAVSKGLATVYTPSELAEMISSKSLRSTNKSEKFEVHSIGDCHIVVKTPRGFKFRNKSTPFDVIVSRGAQVIDSSLSRLFDGVYTVYVHREEAYGLLNVTIRRHKSSNLEEHQVDFGAAWLKAAGWKGAAQLASVKLRNDVETAQVAFTAAYDRLSEDVRCKAKGVSRKAAWQVTQLWWHSRHSLEATARRIQAESRNSRYATTNARREARKALRKQATLAFRGLVQYAHSTNERCRDVIENILVSTGQAAEHIKHQSMRMDLLDLQDKMQEYIRSGRLAKAQERAKQLLRDTSDRWRHRRTTQRARRAGCGKKGRACNR